MATTKISGYLNFNPAIENYYLNSPKGYSGKNSAQTGCIPDNDMLKWIHFLFSN